MERHTKNGQRKGAGSVRRFFIPAALMAAVSLPTASGQSTMRIVPADSTATESPVVRHESVIAAPSAAQKVPRATQIRIVSPANENSTESQSQPNASKDLWAPLSQQSVATLNEQSNVAVAPSTAPQQKVAGNEQAQPDLFGQLFTSAMRPAHQPGAQTTPIEQRPVPIPASDPLHPVAPVVDDPVAFAPVENTPIAESARPEQVARPDLFSTLFTIASESAPAATSPNTVVTAPETSRIVVAVQAPAQPAGSTMRIVIDQPNPADLSARLSTANTEAISQKIEEVISQPMPGAAVAANQSGAQPLDDTFVAVGPDLFGGLSDAGSNISPAPRFSVTVPTLPTDAPQPIAQAPVAPPKPVLQPVGIVTEAPPVSVPQFAASQQVAQSPVASAKPLQQPAGVVTEAPSITVPQYAASQPIAKAPVTPQKPVHQPVGIVTEAPSVSVPQFATVEPIAQAPIAPAKPLQQPVGLVKELPAVPMPQVAASESIAQAPAAPLKHVERLFDVPAEAMASPEPQHVASAPIVAAPVSQPTIVERPAAVAVTQPVESNPEPQAVDPVPARVATSANLPAPTEAAVAEPTPEQPLDDYRFAGISKGTYRSTSKFAGLQQTGPATNQGNTFMLLPNDTFAYADTKQPADGPSTNLPATTHDATATSQTMVNSPEPLGEPQHLAAGCNGLNGMPNSCPYLPGQSGAPLVCGVDCGRYGAPCCATWRDSRCIPWSLFGPGEYVGPARPEHVSTYYLRVNDQITLTFITSRKKEAERYRIGCGDRLKLEWLRGPAANDATLDREVLVQPDGTIALPLVGEVNAAGKTVKDLQDELVKIYGQYQRDPHITVTPLEVNLAVHDIIAAVTGVSGSNGQTQLLKVTPEGTIQAPGLGSVYVQGLTLDELRSELEARYASTFGPGLLVSPSLTERATMYVFVGGEVKTPSRYELQGPTTVMQAITLAGGWNVGGNLHQVVVFRRDENWCLRATKIDVRAPLYGNDPCPANDIWLRDNDLVIVPKSKILCATDVIQLYFTRGIYAAFPINYVYDFSASSGIVPIP